MNEIILVRADQTCIACPSQWDAWDLDGRYWYLRFRSGYGSIGRSYDIDAADLTFDIADEFGGEISLDDFCKRIGVTWAPQYAGRVAVFEPPPPS